MTDEEEIEKAARVLDPNAFADSGASVSLMVELKRQAMERAMAILAPHLAKIKKLEAEVASLRKRLDEPAHVYDPTDWVCTYPWGDRCELQEDLIPGEIKQFATLIDGPPRFMARIVVSVDDAGDADDTEYRWFNSEDEARAALDAALGRDEDNG